MIYCPRIPVNYSNMTCSYLEIPFVLLFNPHLMESPPPRLWKSLPKGLETLCFRDDITNSGETQWKPKRIIDDLTEYLTTMSQLKKVEVSIEEKLDDVKYSSGE